MASARSLANQKLYYARILASSWRQELALQNIPANVLAGAFNDPACQHLCGAYGWFLLEIVPPATLPTVPPVDTTGLPALAPGKALPGELEQHGWIAQMLQHDDTLNSSSKTTGNLAVSVTETPHPDRIDQWIQNMESVFSRMSDSLDEY
jgi:hypothetical protein